MEKIKNYYVYYSYEQFGRGYIGYRRCPEGITPKTDKYLGSFTDNSYKPTEKIILFQDLTKEKAIEIEIKLHAFYDIDKNPHFANKAKQTSIGFSYDTTGSKCYNNSINEIRLFPEEEIPEGFVIGKLCKSEETIKKHIVTMTGNKIINNGKIEKRILTGEEIPEGFILGRLAETLQKISDGNKGNKHSEEHKKRISKSGLGKNKGKIKINNGNKEKFVYLNDKILEGYIIGGLPKSEDYKLSISGEKNPFYGKKHSMESMKKISKSLKGKKTNNSIKVITKTCCYYSIADARKELGISNTKFKNLFEKDPITGFYIEKEKD